MIAIVPILFIVVGLLLHALVANPTAKEFGRACFWIGLLFALAPYARSTVHLFGLG